MALPGVGEALKREIAGLGLVELGGYGDLRGTRAFFWLFRTRGLALLRAT